MKRSVTVALVALALMALAAPAALAKPGFGNLYHDGEVVRTVVPPAANPQTGVDDFYAVVDGADGQLGIAAVAPGDKDYHGGKWAWHDVTWNVAPYLLMSETAVLDAAALGHVTVTRDAERDFKCPIQP